MWNNSLVYFVVKFFEALPAYFMKGLGGAAIMIMIWAAIHFFTINVTASMVAITVVVGILALGWFLQEIMGW